VRHPQPGEFPPARLQVAGRPGLASPAGSSGRAAPRTSSDRSASGSARSAQVPLPT